MHPILGITGSRSLLAFSHFKLDKRVVDAMLSPAPSPGPQLPGAWPASSPRPPAQSLHLEHVLEFQQRLVNQMDKTEIPSTPSFSRSVSAPDSCMAPADSLDSELTRVRTDTSMSLATDSSLSTTYTSHSSPERCVTSKYSPVFTTKYTSVQSPRPTRIPRPSNSPPIRSAVPAESQIETDIFSYNSPSPPSRTTNTTAAQISPSASPSVSRRSKPPVSPIVFASPASSSFPRFSNSQYSPHRRSYSHDYNSSTSPETSYGSEYYDRHMLHPSPSPSPSPMSGRPNLASSVATRTPSIEISAAPMLTSLSLPASPETTMSLDDDPIVPISPRLSPVDCQSSPWNLSLSPGSPVLSNVPDLSLSSPVVESNTVDGHVVSFPSPSTSASPVESSLSSPALASISELDYIGNTSAAEYANAVVSSAWGPAIPVGLLSTEDGVNAVPHLEQSDPAVQRQELPQSSAASASPRHRDAKPNSVLGKMKKLTDKFKQLLWSKPKAHTRNDASHLDVNSSTMGNFARYMTATDILDIQSPASAAQVYNGLLPDSLTDAGDIPLPIPPPPGLPIPRYRTRSNLSSRTYVTSLAGTRAYDNTRQTTPTIRIHPPNSSSHPAIANERIPSKSPSPDLTIHSRPKTLAEIKSKRRLSLSVLPSFSRASSPTPPMNVVTSNRDRARPASALAFYQQPSQPPSIVATTEADNNMTRERLEIPVFCASHSSGPAAVSGAGRSDFASTVHPSDHNRTTDSVRKKRQRFSLSTLSSFSGHREGGSWGRNA
ncbi:aspartate aminotransferase [Favolaschia claudopus]|uniref:Aspartate aminotransferase n=1 Tax=Favolaschia claudopus TaxID=2862362 RepID=A0AAW0EGW0_9AGAR